MWIIISFIFLVAALFSQNTDFWILWAMMIIAHNIEWVGLQIRKFHDNKEQSTDSLQ